MTHPETYPALERALQRSRERHGVDRALLLERLRKDIEWYETLGEEHAGVVQTLKDTLAFVSQRPLKDTP